MLMEQVSPLALRFLHKLWIFFINDSSRHETWDCFLCLFASLAVAGCSNMVKLQKGYLQV